MHQKCFHRDQNLKIDGLTHKIYLHIWKKGEGRSADTNEALVNVDDALIQVIKL